MGREVAEHLNRDELVALVRRVFAPRPQDRRLALLVDLPDAGRPDNDAWRDRRHLALEWLELLRSAEHELGIQSDLYLYRNVGSNNADLPRAAWRHRGGALPGDADALDGAGDITFVDLLGEHPLVMALSELSATAPLKVASPRFGFRAATMPGFNRAMIPALRLDYEEVNRRVIVLADLLTDHQGADLVFAAEGELFELHLDLRHRKGHASGGLVREPGTAGNLPSGEAYIVPYEGERSGDPSRSRGVLPVQHGDEVVRYRIVGNRAIEVLGGGPAAREEARRLTREPARGNLAELGLGVLDGLGVEAIGSVLLDEKLGLHIAFGRSDHFGGVVGASDFSIPQAVIHLDHVYLPELQPLIEVSKVDLVAGDGGRRPLMRDGRYVVSF